MASSSLGARGEGRGESKNHSALVEKYSSFLAKSKAGTPSGGDLSLHHHHSAGNGSHSRQG